MGTTSSLFGGAKAKTQEFLATGQIIVPGGVVIMDADGIGAGGGAGSGAPFTSKAGGSGGEAGQYGFNIPIPVIPGETLDIEIGAAGAGGPLSNTGSTGNDGTAGGDTLIKRGSTVLVRFRGGKPGLGGDDGARAGGETTDVVIDAPFGRPAKGGDTADGLAGEAGENSSMFDGGTGGAASSLYGGGGGGGASLWGDGGNASDGNDSAGSNSGEDALANTGAGGGGSGCGMGTANKGGDGGSGRVLLKWTQ